MPIIGKALALFGELSGYAGHGMKPGLRDSRNCSHPASPARISKGGIIRGCPVVVLDYPRCFGRDEFLPSAPFLVGPLFQRHPASERELKESSFPYTDPSPPAGRGGILYRRIRRRMAA